MSNEKGASGVDNTHRKTWDRAEFHQKAKDREIRDKELEETQLDARKRKRLERDPLHLGLIVERGKLKPRECEVDLTSRLNRSHVQSLTSPSQQGGYHCDICDCSFQDSLAYLDHLNGKYHNRALGMSMEVKRSTADEVRKRLENAKCRKLGHRFGQKDEQPTLLEEGPKLLKESADVTETESSQSLPDGGDDEDSDVARIMGFGSFG